MKNIAVITGASSGMGRKYVEKLCSRDEAFDEIWMIARRQEPMEKIAEQWPKYRFKILPLDLSKNEDILKYKDTLKAEPVTIKLLVNNAGFGKTGRFAMVDIDHQLGMIDVNIRALTVLTHISLSYMKRGSKIINMASVAGFMPQPFFAVYAATKAYVVSFSRALRVELKDQGIKVLTVCPGPVETEFFQNAGPVNSLKKGFFEEAEAVVAKALRDLDKGRAMSVKGIPMNALRLIAKLLPHQVIMYFIKE